MEKSVDMLANFSSPASGVAEPGTSEVEQLMKAFEAHENEEKNASAMPGTT